MNEQVVLSAQEQQIAREALYRDANTLLYGDNKPTEDAIDRVVAKLNHDIDKRAKFSRKRANEDEGDITYINERNRVFNKKVCLVAISFAQHPCSTSSRSRAIMTSTRPRFGLASNAARRCDDMLYLFFSIEACISHCNLLDCVDLDRYYEERLNFASLSTNDTPNPDSSHILPGIFNASLLCEVTVSRFFPTCRSWSLELAVGCRFVTGKRAAWLEQGSPYGRVNWEAMSKLR
jgi:hypothetical protein